MNFLIVLPKMINDINEFYLFPTGIAYVTASIKQAGYNVFTLNLNRFEQDTYDVLKQTILENNIDVVCTGGLSSQYNALKEVVDNSKKIKPAIFAVVGGGFITSDPQSAMLCIPNIDVGIIGEGDISICELANALENNLPLKNIGGLIIKEDTDYFLTPKREDIKDLDALPFPDYEGFQIEELLAKKSNIFGFHGDGNITIVTSRSCPFNCTFCFHPSGQTYRTRSLDNIFEEIDYFTQKYNIKCITMIDELFAQNEERLKEFCKRISKYNISWRTSIRVPLASREILRLMKQSGCIQVTYGIESGDDNILKSMRKKITVAQTREALNNSYAENMAVMGTLIFGDIEETMESVQKSLDFYNEHIHTNIDLSLIMVFPGSYLYEYACEKGIIKDRVEYIKQGCPLINVSKLTDEQYSDLAIKITELNDCQDIVPKKWEIINTNFKTGMIEIKADCYKCGAENIWYEMPILSQIRRPECVECSQVHSNFYAPLFYENAVNNLLKLKEKYKDVAIWGLARHITNIFKNFLVISQAGITVMDSSIAKQGNMFYNNKISSIDALKEKNIKVLINTVSDERYSEVKRELNSMDLPELKYYATLGDILNPDFNIEEFEYKKGK